MKSAFAAFFLLTSTLSFGAAMVEVPGSALPAIAPEGNLADFKLALTRQISQCKTLDKNAAFRFADRAVAAKKWCRETNQAFLKLANQSHSFAELMALARKKFRWFKSVGDDGKGSVLFTGYYFPALEVSDQPSNEFRFPVFRQPEDLVQTAQGWRKKNTNGTFTLFDDRDAIDFHGALDGRGLEIAWSNRYLDVYGLQVEGSGVLLYKGGRRQVVNFAASNGQAYVSLRRILMEQGVTDPSFLTWQGIQRYFELNPGQLQPSVIKNPSYVFFKTADDGPYGNGGALLTAGHSIAIDASIFPMGAVAFIKGQRPNRPLRIPGADELIDFSRFAVAQDTGGAIKGPGHIDMYWGEGADAEWLAGQLNNVGELYFALVP